LAANVGLSGTPCDRRTARRPGGAAGRYSGGHLHRTSGELLVLLPGPDPRRGREGEKLELWVDPHKAQLFNPQNGAHLTL